MVELGALSGREEVGGVRGDWRPDLANTSAQNNFLEFIWCCYKKIPKGTSPRGSANLMGRFQGTSSGFGV